MADLKINYSLSLGQTLTFPLVSTYGVRHLKKKGWQNKVIGVIELFPLIGALASLIEKACHSVFKNKNKSTEARNKTSFRDSSEKFKQQFESFKQNALRDFAARTAPVPKSPIVLTESQKDELKQAFWEIEHNTGGKFTKENLLYDNTVWVFTIPSMPEYIFKVPKTYCPDDNVLSRVKSTELASEVIEKENLYLLKTPSQCLLKFNVDDKEIEALVEEKLDHISSQGTLFQLCLQTPELKPFMEECVKQLTTLIIKIGYRDVRGNNNPLLLNGQGFALFDLDGSENPQFNSIITGLISGCSTTGTDGLLSLLTPDFLDAVTPTIKKLLNEEDFAKLKLDELKAKKQAVVERTKEFEEYLKTSKPIDRKHKKQFKFKPKTFYSTPDRDYLTNQINGAAQRSLGINPTIERQFFIYATCSKHLQQHLNHFKETKQLFHWEKSGSGYFVWC